jgi:hypothetical protein
LIYLVLLLLFFAIYTSWRVDKTAGVFSEAIDKFNEEIKELKTLANKPETSMLPEEWTRDRWASEPTKEEKRRPLENPNPLSNPDLYTEEVILTELDARPDPVDRVAFLTALRGAGTWFSSKLVDRLLKDESPKVRAWAAANVATRFNDYTDFRNPVELANYEPRIQSDPDPFVRASIWRNSNCEQLPWSLMSIAEDWKERLKGMTQLERLALMRNPELALRYLVSLLEANSEDLGITRKEHAEMIYAGAINQRLVWSSRHHGREYWMAYGDVNSPFEEFGQMWELSLDKWIDLPFVPYAFLKFVQTTPKIKLSTYERLFKLPDDTHPQQFRKVLIEGCDPFTDKDILKLAWDDPDKDCQEAARERVGGLTKWVGVSDKPRKT